MTAHALIVDDSKTACKLLAERLSELGLSSDSVYSAEQALEYLRHWKPDIVFLDHSMPGMDGLETIRIIKSRPGTATIPVMMYTSQDGDVYFSQARALGAVDVLTKEGLTEHLGVSLARIGLGTAAATPGESSPMPEVTHDGAPQGQPTPLANNPAASPSVGDPWTALQRLRTELIAHTDQTIARQHKAQREGLRTLQQGIDSTIRETAEAIRNELIERDTQQAQQAATLAHGHRRIAIGLLAALLLSFLVAGWQLFESHTEARQLAARLQDVRGGLASLQGRLEGLSPQLNANALLTASERPAPTVATNAAPRFEDSLRLQSAQGEVVGRVIGTHREGQSFEAVTRRGYLFAVDARGAIGTPLKKRYFSAPGCNGEPHVPATPGVIYRDGRNELWFTSRVAQLKNLRALSVLDGTGACTSIDALPEAMLPLTPNRPATTGIGQSEEPISLAGNDS